MRLGGQSWSAEVVCFKTNPLSCTLLARWDLNYKDPWLILTDFKPEEANVLWYGLRSCTECVYRDLKSDGWQWHHTRVLSPQRAERMWLVLAVFTKVDDDPRWHLRKSITCLKFSTTSPGHIACYQPGSFKKGRTLSCFLLAFVTLMANLLNNRTIHLERWRAFLQTPVDAFYPCNSS